MNGVPFFHRLSTRLTLLILAVVAVLTGAAIALLARGFSLAQRGLLEGVGTASAADLDAVIRGTVINLIAVFLFTLVAATIFSRSLLTEPISSLMVATRELAEGNLGVTLPVTSTSELGELARAFNQMSLRLAEGTRELTDSNAALRASEQRYAEALELTEQRVQERTAELAALLELSNAIALTLELHPLLDRILDRLHEAVGDRGAVVLERAHDGTLTVLARRGRLPLEAEELAPNGPLGPGVAGVVGLTAGTVFVAPLTVRERELGLLLLSPPAGERFREEQVRIANAFANQAAVALENDKLYDQVHEQAALEERQHLARELHDSVSQALYGILLGAHSAQKQLRTAPDRAEEALAYVEHLAQAGIAEMRALIFELRPEALERDGLVGALKRQLDALESRHSLETNADLGSEPELPLATKQVLFRIAQEAIHNVVKHARAERVRVRLASDAERVRLEVEDDGVGFDTSERFPSRLGLRSMRERAGALGGALELTSGPGSGTLVVVEVPADAAERRRERS